MAVSYGKNIPRVAAMRWAYHIISWVYGTHFYQRACNGVRKHHTTRPTHRHRPNGRVPLGG